MGKNVRKEEHSQGAGQHGPAKLTVNVPQGERECDTATATLEFVAMRREPGCLKVLHVATICCPSGQRPVSALSSNYMTCKI